MRKRTVLCGVPFPARNGGKRAWDLWRKGFLAIWCKGQKEDWSFTGEPVRITIEIQSKNVTPVPVGSYPSIHSILVEAEIISPGKQMVKSVEFKTAYARQEYQTAVVVIERTK